MKRIVEMFGKLRLVAFMLTAFFALGFMWACDDGGGKLKGVEGEGGIQVPGELASGSEMQPGVQPGMQPVDIANQPDTANQPGEGKGKSGALIYFPWTNKLFGGMVLTDTEDQEEKDKAQKDLETAEDKVEEKANELEGLESGQAAADAEAAAQKADKIDKLELRLKVGSSAKDGGSANSLNVQFCKSRKNCSEKVLLPSTNTDSNSENTFEVPGGYAEGDVLETFVIGGSFPLAKDMTITKDDLNVIKFCVGAGDDPLYISAVMVNVNDEVFYFNPAFYRMLNKGSCTNLIRNEDAFILFASDTSAYVGKNWLNANPFGDDDTIGINFDVTNCSNDAIADIKADYDLTEKVDGTHEMNHKYLQDANNNGTGLLKGLFDSDINDFTMEPFFWGLYGFSAPVANCVDFEKFTLVAYAGDTGQDHWNGDEIEIFAGKVSDLVDNYCYHLSQSGPINVGNYGSIKPESPNFTMGAKGICQGLSAFATKNTYAGAMGKGDFPPPQWFTDLTDYQNNKGKPSIPKGVESGTDKVAEPSLLPEIVNAEKSVADAFKAADTIAGQDENGVLNPQSVLAKLNDKIKDKKLLFDATSDKCYDKQVNELKNREFEIKLAYAKATTAALKAKESLLNMKIYELKNLKNLKDLLDVNEKNAKYYADEATKQKTIATELLNKPLADACTADEKAAAQAPGEDTPLN